MFRIIYSINFPAKKQAKLLITGIKNDTAHRAFTAGVMRCFLHKVRQLCNGRCKH